MEIKEIECARDWICGKIEEAKALDIDHVPVYETIKVCLTKSVVNCNEWQPIGVAPKDFTKILTYNGNGGGYNGSGGDGEGVGDIAVAQYDNIASRWYLPHCCDGVSYNEPTHWMPLPEPPEVKL
jgi:hypothetical protein